jgi:hypothetical protein
MHQPGQQCIELLKMTADQLSDSVVALMLFAVQKDNLKLNINQAVEWYVCTYSTITMRGTVFITGHFLRLNKGLGVQKP